MFESRVLGVDPGIASIGLAVLTVENRRPSTVWFDTLRTPDGLREELRLREIYRAVRAAIADHRPGAMAVERVLWGQNKTSALRVARATGAVMLAAADAAIEVEEYAPLQIKMAVTGVGNAPKDQVRRALSQAHGMRDLPTQADAADAVAVGVCHLTQSGLRRAVSQAAAR
jgi:crossover junction endodeoxyribonuclease RuvC